MTPDRAVAELILREAKQKAEKFGTEGMRAYLNTKWVQFSMATVHH